MGYSFGKKSTAKLKDCEIDLQKILTLSIQTSKIDFSIIETHRGKERQMALYMDGKSMIDGVTRKGKHNYYPSMAVDIMVYHKNKDTRLKIAYDNKHLCYIAGVIDGCAAQLLDTGKITHKIRFGGNWDNDGVIMYDQSFQDLCHFELI